MTDRLRNDTIIHLGTYLGTIFRDDFLDETGESPVRNGLDQRDGLDQAALEIAWRDVRRLLEIGDDDHLFTLFAAAFDAAVFHDA